MAPTTLPQVRLASFGADQILLEAANTYESVAAAGRDHASPHAGAAAAMLELSSERSALFRRLRQTAEKAVETQRAALAATEESEAGPCQRVLLTLVFTDIVSSTETLERLGDRGWCSLLRRHRELVRTSLETFRGCELDATGDGFFLAFDRPSRAVSFARLVRDALKAIGVAVRVGIHTGECEVVGDRIEGVAVHTAARVAGAATASEILVSSTVRDLVAGSEHRFEKREVRILKGLSEPRQLFALDCA